jgi:putative ABC transport system permease protein
MGPRSLRGLEAEIRDHIDRETEENIARGLSPQAARAIALRKFGNTALAAEDARRVWIPLWFDGLLQDTRYALRQLRRSPAFSGVIIATLAIAIGITTAVFSIFDAVVLKPVTYRDADRLVWIALHGEVPAGAILSTDFAAWREQATTFERMAAYYPSNQALSIGDAAIQTRVASVSDDFWGITDARLVLGRLPGPGEREVVLLSHRLFEGWFRADSAVIGRTVSLGGQPTTIIGVLAPEFALQFPQPSFVTGLLQAQAVDAYRPMSASAQDRRRGTLVRVVGKLKSDVDLARAHADIETVRGRLAHTNPLPFSDRAQLQVTALQNQLAGNNRVGVTTLLAAGAFVLIIACANIAGLFLARSATRQHEMAVRASIGAGSPRMLRQLLTESFIFSVFGALSGVAVANVALRAFLSYGPDSVPRLANAHIDARVLAVVIAITVLTALACGLGPALSVVRMPLESVLRSGSIALMAGRGQGRARSALVIVQIATAVVLLTGAGLMLKTMWRLNARPPGFNPERILTMRVEFSGPQYRDSKNRRAYVDEVLGRVSAAPGVAAAGITTGIGALMRLRIEGRPDIPPGERPPGATVFATSPGYDSALGFRIVAGRWISETDTNPVLVVNESLARREFGAESPIGHRMRLPWPPADPNPPFATIVGVVADLRYSQLDAQPEPEVFAPYAFADLFGVTLTVRTAVEPSAVAASLTKLVTEVDPSQPVFNVKTLDAALAESIALRRFILLLTATFAGIALLLALLGIYAIMASNVAARRKEIGLRIALGAQPRAVMRAVIRQATSTTLLGVLVGTLASAALTRFMVSLLYGVEPTDAATFFAVITTTGIGGLLASIGPAMKASSASPLSALRAE